MVCTSGHKSKFDFQQRYSLSCFFGDVCNEKQRRGRPHTDASVVVRQQSAWAPRELDVNCSYHTQTIRDVIDWLSTVRDINAWRTRDFLSEKALSRCDGKIVNRYIANHSQDRSEMFVNYSLQLVPAAGWRALNIIAYRVPSGFRIEPWTVAG